MFPNPWCQTPQSLSRPLAQARWHACRTTFWTCRRLWFFLVQHGIYKITHTQREVARKLQRNRDYDAGVVFFFWLRTCLGQYAVLVQGGAGSPNARRPGYKMRCSAQTSLRQPGRHCPTGVEGGLLRRPERLQKRATLTSETRRQTWHLTAAEAGPSGHACVPAAASDIPANDFGQPVSPRTSRFGPARNATTTPSSPRSTGPWATLWLRSKMWQFGPDKVTRASCAPATASAPGPSMQRPRLFARRSGTRDHILFKRPNSAHILNEKAISCPPIRKRRN